MTFEELKVKLKEIKNHGYIKTHRVGQTGVGKTLEDLLGIEENNIPGPNAMGLIEIKSARKNSKSMLTLFTKSPLPRGINSELLKRFGYFDPERKEKVLHTTVNGVFFNKIQDNDGFKVEIENDRLNLICKSNEIVAYWEETILKKSFEKKLGKLLYVKAEVRGDGKEEEFWYNEAYLLKNFSFDKFKELIRKGDILIDIRIGRYPNGKTHDHGTAFRVFPDKLDLCFEKRERII